MTESGPPADATATTIPLGAVPGMTIRFFLSSTFADFQVERDVLQRRVFPELRQLCIASGFHLQPIDLRWGVSEAAGTDRQTLRICFEELQRCRALSPDFFLFIQLGNRYGSHIPSPQLPADLVERVLPHLTPEERSAFATAYRLDENAAPVEYVLLRASGPERAEDEALRGVLVRAGRAADLTDTERLPFEGSATHREIQLGLVGMAPSDIYDQGVLCAVRSFRGQLQGPELARFVEYDDERGAQIRRLTEVVLDRLPSKQVMRYEVDWRDDTGPVFDEDMLAGYYLGLLRPRIEAVIAARASARAAAAAQGRDAVALANATFETQRAKQVEGRDAELARIAAYLADRDGAGLPLVVTGAAGSGKSTLVAEAAKRAANASPNAVVLARYIGVTPGTSSLIELLAGLRRAIAVAYRLREPEPIADPYQLLDAVSTQLATLKVPPERPLLLFVDALDQLSASTQPVDWLPRTLPAGVRLVISVLPDRTELVTLRERLPDAQVLTVGALNRQAGGAALRYLLQADGRRVAPEQERVILDGFAARGLPLYLRVAAGEARHWRSFDPAEPLPDSIAALLDRILERMEEPGRHGHVLVAHALGDLAAARTGLAEDELLDILARDDAVRADVQKLSEHSPPIRADLPLPVALWARLYVEMQWLLTEREEDGARQITFYHRQLYNEAKQRYLLGGNESDRHHELAEYFGQQSYWLAENVWNRRKVSELAFQWEQSGAAGQRQLKETLTDGRFLEGRLTVAGHNAVEEELDRIRDDAAIQHIRWVMSAWATFLDDHARELATQVEGRRSGARMLHHGPWEWGIPALNLLHPTLSRNPVHVRTFLGHNRFVTDCAFSPDGRLILSSGEKTLRLWDVASGREIRRFDIDPDVHSTDLTYVSACAFSPDGRLALGASVIDHSLSLWDVNDGRLMKRFFGHTKGVTDCAFSPDGNLIVSASEDGTLRLWDVASGRQASVLKGRTRSVKSCAFSPDGRLVLGGSGAEYEFEVEPDHSVRLWEVAGGHPPRRFEGHTEAVNDCAFSPDGQQILSASGDHTLRLWETATGQLIRLFEGHTAGVYGCAFSPDGRQILSASGDTTLRLWDVATGQELRRFEGHLYSVYACAFNPDGRQIVSASRDESLRLWDLTINQPARVLSGQQQAVRDCALNADGRVALTISQSDNDETLRVWDVTSGEVARLLLGQRGGVSSCALSADGRLALSGGHRGTLQVWDVRTGEVLRTFKRAHRRAVTGCALSADGRVAVSASYDGTLRLWDVATGRQVRVLRVHTGYRLMRCALSADGRIAVSVSSRSALRSDQTAAIWVWDLATGRLLRGYKMRSSLITPMSCPCAVSADGSSALIVNVDHLTVVAVTGDENQRQLDVPDWKATVKSGALSGDGRIAVSVSHDDHVAHWSARDSILPVPLRVWDVATGQILATVHFEGSLDHCAISTNGHRIMVVASDGMVHFLELVGVHRTPQPNASEIASTAPLCNQLRLQRTSQRDNSSPRRWIWQRDK